METIPSIWRTEVLHALSVHLPLTSLILAALLFLVSWVVKKSWIIPASGFLLIIGTIGAWISMFTGNAADGIVARTICDPTVLKDHDNGALTTSILFTAASILYFIPYTQFSPRFRLAIKIVTSLVLIVATAFLMYVGHLGASLVYQQGAGTFQPSPDCIEFNDK
jgi:uncharacterized membrane protein